MVTRATIDRFAAIVAETQTQCLAWVLIPNHVHLLLRTGRVPIATVMQRLLTGHAVSFNRKYRRHGQLFQNRYKSILAHTLKVDDRVEWEAIRRREAFRIRPSQLLGKDQDVSFMRFDPNGYPTGFNPEDRPSIPNIDKVTKFLFNCRLLDN